MRFVWKLITRDLSGPSQHEKLAMQAAQEAKEAAQENKQHQEHLKSYFEATEKLSAQEKKEFSDNLIEWYRKGDKVSMRMAGISEADNDKDYLRRHARISSAFVTWDKKGERLSGSVDFKKNDTAEYKVGLGDILPPNVKAVRVEKKEGGKVYCVRVRNPRTGRIGYYDANSLAKGEYRYVAVHTGDRFEVMRTMDPKAPKTQRDILAEHLAVYKQGAMEANDGEELYYNDKGQPLSGSPGAKRERRRTAVYQKGARQRAGFRQAMDKLGVRTAPRRKPRPAPRKHLPAAPQKAPRLTQTVSVGGETVEVNGKPYQALTRDFLERFIGTTPEKTSRWLIESTFLGQPVRVSPLVLPYLKEAESRIKKAHPPINFKLKPEAGGCQCYNHRGIRRLDGGTNDTLSKHSWGIALDLNPGDHPFGTEWHQLLNPDKVPMRMVEIMKACGFRWGNEFRNKDPMHFELMVNPFTSQGLITSEEGKKAVATLEDFAGGLGNQTRQAWARTKEAPGAPKLASGSFLEDIELSKTTDAATIANDHRQNLEKMGLALTGYQEKLMNGFFENFEAHKKEYEDVGKAAGVPAILVAIIHFRESGMKFDRYLHNGEKLGKPTTYVPKGVLFHEGQWKEAAIHALGGNIRDVNGKPSLASFRALRKRLGLNENTTDMGKIMAFCEFYNGLGYRNKHDTTSAYVYAGTNLDKGGMYVADGRFDPGKKDPRIGAGAILLEYRERGQLPPAREGTAIA